jgi:ABC-type Na+ efflux pump permease subunit
MKAFTILLKRELKAVTREKTIMFAILIQFLIASLSSVLLVGIMAFYDPSSISQNSGAHIRVGVVQELDTPLPAYLAAQGIGVSEYNSSAAAGEAFSSGRVDALIQIPAAHAGIVDMQLTLPELDTSQTVVMMLLQEPLKRYENYLRENNGIQVNYDNLGGKPGNSYEFLYTIIVPVLMLFPALIAGSIIIDTIAEEFQNKTFEILISSPVSLKQILSAKVAAAVLTALAQVLLWVGLLRLNGTVIANPLPVVALAVVAAALIAFIAAFTALFFKDRERAQFAYSILLVVVVSASYFLGFSPINLISGLAAGSGQVSLIALLAYPAAALVLGTLFFKFSRFLTYRK